MGRQAGERRPDAIVAVVDATNLDNHLRFVLQLKKLALPLVVALNMIDLAKRDGLEIDPARLSELLGVAVIPTVAVRRRGLDALADALDTALAAPPPEPAGLSAASPVAEADAHDPAPPIGRASCRERVCQYV